MTNTTLHTPMEAPMTRKNPATPAPALAPFDGKDVLSTTVAITNAGDGLSQAMAVDPVELHHSETCWIVLECEVAKVRFDPIKDTDALQRVHILRAGAAVMVDEDLVRDHLDRMAERIEAHAGIRRLPDGAMYEAHQAGEHAPERVDGCQQCQDEVDAEEAEAAEQAQG